ncbi:hypothetical protein OMCYN_01666 [cyanobiont of Ornithocercus magnificus]|nr:hypothetical protein OMCYN_01666 [cyanobiont of Ornithocercus magnificus]
MILEPYEISGLGVAAVMVAGRPYISRVETMRATRPNSRDTKPLDRWLAAGGGSLLPPSKNYCTEVPAHRPQGGTSRTQLISPFLAFAWWHQELKNRSKDVRDRALALVELCSCSGLQKVIAETVAAPGLPATDELRKLIDSKLNEFLR